MQESCPRCGGNRVVPGKTMNGLGYWRGLGGTLFRPFGLQRLMFLFNPTIAVRDPIQACLDCGLMWGDLSARQLRQTIIGMGSHELKRHLGLG